MIIVICHHRHSYSDSVVFSGHTQLPFTRTRIRICKHLNTHSCRTVYIAYPTHIFQLREAAKNKVTLGHHHHHHQHHHIAYYSVCKYEKKNIFFAHCRFLVVASSLLFSLFFFHIRFELYQKNDWESVTMVEL